MVSKSTAGYLIFLIFVFNNYNYGKYLILKMCFDHYFIAFLVDSSMEIWNFKAAQIEPRIGTELTWQIAKTGTLEVNCCRKYSVKLVDGQGQSTTFVGAIHEYGIGDYATSSHLEILNYIIEDDTNVTISLENWGKEIVANYTTVLKPGELGDIKLLKILTSFPMV